MSDTPHDRWDADGVPTQHAKQCARFCADEIRRAFPSYLDEGTRDPFAELVATVITALNDLRPAKGGPAFLGSDPSGPTSTRRPERAAAAPRS